MATAEEKNELEEASIRKEGEELLFGIDLNALDSVEFGADQETPSNTSCANVDNLLHIERLLLSTPDFSLDPPARDEDFLELFQWATEKGAVLSSVRYGRDQFGGRGLFTSRNVRKGDILAVLPRSLRIGQKLACQRIPSLGWKTPDLTALSLLLLDFYMDDEYKGYIQTLPRRGEFTNAIFMTNEDIEKWRLYGQEYGESIHHVRAKCNACISYIQDKFLSSASNRANTCTDAIRWAIAMVLSRSHAFASSTGRWLTPVLDLANHSEDNASAKLEVDDTGGLLLMATRDLKCAEEVTLDYQEDKDENLVATYGFSLLHS